MSKSTNRPADKSLKAIPEFENENLEREFWTDADSTDHLDWDSAERVVLSELKPSHKTISLRMSGIMLSELKRLANKRDVPYQSLLKTFLAERLEQERSRSGSSH